MKSVLLLFLGCLPMLINAQTVFSEICPDETTNGTVVDFEMYNGSLYATGFFNQVCGQPTGYIAKYENGEWGPAGFSITDPGHFMHEIDGDLYIARYEENIDSNWVMIYDGTAINKLGAGVFLTTASGYSSLPNIYDVIKFNNQIIACGEFDRVGTSNVNGIIAWDGSSWTDLGGGLTGNIQNSAPVIFPHRMLVFNNELYVAGNFRYAGGVEVNGLAKWDGSSWQAMGDGFNSTVYGLGVYNGELYAGGSFTASGNTSLNRIAKWNGTEWVSPGFGFVSISTYNFTFVHTIEEIDGVLHLAGGLQQIAFDDGSTLDCKSIVGFDGTEVIVYTGALDNNDIEAVQASADGNLLIGGGVFGSGFFGILNIVNNLNEVEEREEVHIFPNPSHSLVQISAKTPIRSVQLLSMQGKIMESSFNAASGTLTIAHLPKGIYQVLITTANKIYHQQLVKQ